MDIMFPIRQTEMDEQERELVITFQPDQTEMMKWNGWKQKLLVAILELPENGKTEQKKTQKLTEGMI